MKKIKLVILLLLLFSVININNLFSLNYYETAEDFYNNRAYDKAIEYYNRTLKYYDEVENKPEISLIIYKIGKSYTFKGDYEKAVKYIKEFIEMNPQSEYTGNAAYLLAIIYYRNNEFDKYNSIKEYINKNFPESDFVKDKYWKYIETPRNNEPENNKKDNNSNIQKQSFGANEQYKIETGFNNDYSYNLNYNIQSNIRFVKIDFEKADIKEVIEVISALTGINYIKEFYNITDYVTLKANAKISTEFLPLMLNKIINDYNYNISESNNTYKISKLVAYVNEYTRIDRSYYINVFNNKNEFNKMLDNLQKNESDKIKYSLYQKYNYIIFESDNIKTIYDYIDSVKKFSSELDRYIEKTYRFKNIDSEYIVKLLNAVKFSGEKFVNDFFKQNRNFSKNQNRIRNMLSESNNINAIKNIIDIKSEKSNNSLKLRFNKLDENLIDKIISVFENNVFIQESDDELKVFKIKYVSAKDVADKIEKLFSSQYNYDINERNTDLDNLIVPEKRLKKIVVNGNNNSILISADISLLNRIEKMINLLDVQNNYPVLRIYKLRYAKSNNIKQQLSTLIDNRFIKIYNVNSDENTNSVIILAEKGSYGIIDKIINKLDVAYKTELNSHIKTYIFTLKNKAPEYVYEKLNEILINGIYANSKNIYRIFKLDDQNQIVLLTDDFNSVPQWNKWISKFDVKTSSVVLKEQPNFEQNDINSYVYYCKNVPAEELSKMLNNIINSLKNIKVSETKKNSNSEDMLIHNNVILSSNVTVTHDKTSNSIVITASKKDYNYILNFINKVDKIPDQIFIDVMITEVNLKEEEQTGIEWKYGNSNVLESNFGLRSYEDLSNSALKLEGLRYAILDSKKFSAILNYMQSNTKVKILSRPRITTAHNKKASIKIGSEVPITKIEQTTPNSEDNKNLLNNYINKFTEFKDVGITLEVTPKTINNSMISMDIHLIVSEIDESSQYQDALGNPTILKRETTTYGTVKSANTIVIGGLIKNDEIDIEKKVPVLGDLPIVGSLFKRNTKNKSSTELLIFITPRFNKLF